MGRVGQSHVSYHPSLLAGCFDWGWSDVSLATMAAMAQHYMTVINDNKLKDKETKPHRKRFTFFETRRAAKWHQAITFLTTYWTIRPVTRTSAPANKDSLSVFPYAETQLLTKEYLGRTKSQEDTDRRLLELIKNHDCKEVAFAACASWLSSDAVQGFLDTEFEDGSDRAITIEPYLQAFVAAAYWKSLDFTLRDSTFATILVCVVDDASARQWPTLHMLISAWRAGPPKDKGLQSRALSLTATVFHNARLKLEQYQSILAWRSAKQYRAPLLLLDEAFKTAGPLFEGCVKAFFPKWRCWARWTPDDNCVDQTSALKLWQRMQQADFICLQELDGPDAVDGDEFEATAWQGLIRRQRLIPWLESKRFRIGVGLIVGDTEGLLTEFVEHFRRVVSLALAGGRTSVGFLATYIEREGLDSATLTAWEEARRLLIIPLPKFVEYIKDMPPTAYYDDELDVLVANALKALMPSSCAATRRPITAEVSQCVQLACGKLDTDLRRGMDMLELLDYKWLPSALRLWRLREIVAASTWLHPAIHNDILQASVSQPPIAHLEVLYRLHVRVRKADYPSLRDALDVYVYSYAVDSKADSQRLARALHVLWIRTHDHGMRESGVTIATLEGLGVDLRSACIGDLAHGDPTVIKELDRCLRQVKTKAVGSYMGLTEAVMSLAGPLGVQACWAGLLSALLASDAIFVDQVEFTDKGYKAYVRWIQHVDVLFGGKLSLSADIHAWLQQLEPVESVFESLEAVEHSGKIMHRLLTTTKPESCKWHLKIPTRIHAENREKRRTFMLTLLKSLHTLNAGTICTAICASATLSDADFATCQQFLDIAREKSRDLAAARLAIWLNMSEYSPMLKAVLIDVGEVLGLKESAQTWLAAKEHYKDKVEDLLVRARKLEDTRMTLMRTGREDVEEMMTELKMEVPAGVSAVLAELPAELVDVVEDVFEDQLELHFSLSHLHSLTTLALGVQGTETVVVTLRIFGGGVVDGFCVHVEETVGVAPTMSHSWIDPREIGTMPTQFVCRGKQSRLSVVLARAIWRELEGGENCDIPALYARVKGLIRNGANECMVCAKDIGANLHRATVCGSLVCTLIADSMDFAVWTETLRQDRRVMDLLFTAVHAVATARNVDLLPGLPDIWKDTKKLLAMLNALPATDVLAKADNMRTLLRLVSKNADLLTSWLCTASRTFIISATGHWRIPNMPGIHQFLVVDNPPEIEAAFAKHNHLQPRMVLFHGTSMDRLYAILAQGLRVLSNTSLMKHGAVSGAGIYFSSDTALPASYAAATTAKAAGSGGFFKSRGNFDGPQVLLGCEHAGPATKGGVFVVTDPTKVIVRYVFLVPKGVAFPLAKDIVAPMVSTFYSLRASAAVSN